MIAIGTGTAALRLASPTPSDVEVMPEVRLDGAASMARPDLPVPVEIAVKLFQAFARDGIDACYWTSSAGIARALAGEKDLDLLVSRADQHRAAALLSASGFKLFPTVAGRDHPAIVSHVGFDPATGRLVHVHLHLRLVVGTRLLKGLRLPWESVLLGRAVPSDAAAVVRVLDPAADLLMLFVRAALEMNRADPVAKPRWESTMERFRTDIAAAQDRTTPDEVLPLACQLLGAALGGRLTDVLFAVHPLTQRRQWAGVLRRTLSDHRLYGGVEGFARDIARGALGWARRVNRDHLHAPRPWHRQAPGSGIVVAVVGLDGSGKSTMVAMLRSWLGAEVDVMPIYFGTGDGRPSLLLAPFKMLLPLADALFRRKPQGSSHGLVTNRSAGLGYSLAMMVWATAVALEKRGKLARARRAAGRGLVVVADRYPQNEVKSFNDGPLLHRIRFVPTILRRFEAGTYERAAALPPDLVVKLVVTARTAMAREPTMDPDVIASRIAEFDALAFPGAAVVVVNAEVPLLDVVAAVKKAVWNAL